MDRHEQFDVEARTRVIGREIFRRAMEDEPSVMSADWWDERMMALTMRDERLKVQLFRFIDVLPVLKRPEQITRHLDEYLRDVVGALPFPLSKGIAWMPRRGWGASLVAKLALFNTHRLARRFIAGTTVAETVHTIEELRRKSLTFTIDLLGEAVLSEAEADEYQRQYLEFTDGLTRRAAAWPTLRQIDVDQAGAIPKVNVSVKLSSLFSQFDPIDPVNTSRRVRDRLRPILRLAKSRGAFVNIDMEQHAFKDVTLRIFEEVFAEDEFKGWPDVGIAIQAYLRSCGDDLRRLAAFAERRGMPVSVRLVKGAYWDYETVIAAQQDWPVPVFTDKNETDANFEAMTRLLLERRDVLRPAIASHNVRSIAHSLAVAEELGLPPRMIEIQMLYGMADPIKKALVDLGQRVRVYTPFGQLLPGMAYLVRRLLENTSNQSFLRAGFLEHVPVEKLLMNPLDNVPPRTGSSIEVKADRFTNEPPTDFARDDARKAMAAAIEQVRGLLGRLYPLVINGESLDGDGWIDSLNPSKSSEIVGRAAKATAGQAESAVAAARAAFDRWRDTPASGRAKCLRDLAAVLRRRRFELAAWEVFECGKPWRESDADVAEAIDFCEFYAREMLRLAEPWRVDVPGEENEMVYDARGVVVVIAPWNFPLAILTGMAVAALVAGNTVVMKPAEQSPVVAAKLMECIREVGFPKGVVNFLPGVGEEIGPVLVNHPDVAMIAFTGSRSVGLGINREAAIVLEGQDHIKRVIAELGGKNAIIVDDDADVDEAVHGVAASAFGYAGQKCSACSRAIVLQPIYDTFVRRLVEVTRSFTVAPADDANCFVGPVIDAEAHQRILEAIARGKNEAMFVYPRGAVTPVPEGGYFIPPHVFAEVPHESSLAQEEIFGPVLAVLRAKDLDEALRLANGTRYALTGGVYSRSPRTLERVRREFRVGNLYINRKITGALVNRQPFGGFKLSGIGSKAGGPDYLLQFLIPRTITENTLRRGFAPAAADRAAVSPVTAVGE